MYESLSLTQTTIVCAEVTGFIEQKLRFSKDYLFIVEILWTDKRTTYVKRSYGDFFQFYQDIKYHFDDKWLKGILRTPVYIPQINGPRFFRKASRDLAEKREEELHTFLQQLLHGNPLIACNNMVIDFFLPRPADPVPYIAQPDGQVDTTQSTDSHEDCRNDDDEILYVR